MLGCPEEEREGGGSPSGLPLHRTAGGPGAGPGSGAVALRGGSEGKAREAQRGRGPALLGAAQPGRGSGHRGHGRSRPGSRERSYEEGDGAPARAARTGRGVSSFLGDLQKALVPSSLLRSVKSLSTPAPRKQQIFACSGLHVRQRFFTLRRQGLLGRLCARVLNVWQESSSAGVSSFLLSKQ